MPATATVKVAKPKNKALVNEDSCTGCEYCVHWCPVEDCLWMEKREGAHLEPPIGKINISYCIDYKMYEQN